MSRRRAEQLARRQALLELEAEVQRAMLVATITQWEHKPLMNWLDASGRIVLRALGNPRLRWLLLATLWRRFVRSRSRTRASAA